MKDEKESEAVKVDKKEIYTFQNMPPVEDLKDIKFLYRSNGPFDSWILTVFKCKDDCKTIFNFKKIMEMHRFTKELTSDPLWPQLCPRISGRKALDGFGCNADSYGNLTATIEVLANVVDDIK